MIMSGVFAIAALFVLALLYVSLGVSGSFAPLCAVGSLTLWLTVFGCLGLLSVGAWALYILCVGAVLFLCYKHILKKMPLRAPGFAFWLFVGGSVLFLVALSIKQPMFLTWDEFSFWGTAHKLTTLNNELYTTAPVGWAWPATQTPALIVFGYFFQFLGGGFSEWGAYLASDVFMLAAICAVLYPLRKKHWNIAFPIGLCALLVPFLFSHSARILLPSAAYADTLADMPMGLWFAAALCCGLCARKLRDMLPLCIALATLSLIKDMGMFLSLTASVIVFAGFAFSRRRVSLSRRRFWAIAGGRFALYITCALASFILWSVYLSSVAGVNRLEGVGGTQNIGMLQMPFVFLAELFSADKSELFLTVMQGMPQMFMFDEINMFGSGAAVSVLILGIIGFAAWVSKRPAFRRKCLVFAVVSLLGCVAYQLLISMCYIYVFRPEQVFEGYRRYMNPYYIGWFIAALMLLAQGAAGAQKRWQTVSRLCVIMLSAALFVQTLRLVPSGYSVFGLHESTYGERRIFAQKVQDLQQGLSPEDKSFLVISGDSGLSWFMYCYEMLPYQVDYSFGGGEMVQRTLQSDGTTLKQELSAQELSDYLISSGCTKLIVDTADEHFVEMYGGLFSDGLSAYLQSPETPTIYNVLNENGSASLVPA